MITALLGARRFLPLFVVQATGGLNDNLFKNALVILVLFRGEDAGAGLAAAAGGLFILPYALVSAPAGQLADRLDKAGLIRLVKAAEVALMALAAVALLSGSVPFLLAVLFGLGVQAAMFGPLKYGILPQHLAASELVAGNALIEAGTFGSILAGTILGGLLIGVPNGPAIVGALGLASAILGFAASFGIPPAPGIAPRLRIGANVARETWRMILAARGNRPVWLAVLGLSWFWAVGATFLALFPVLVRDVFHAANDVVTLLLAGFVVGVGSGSLLGNLLLHGRLSLRHVAPACAALGLCTLAFAGLCAGPWAASWSSPGALLRSPAGLAAWIALLGAAMAGGVFSLPLYATLQASAAPGERSRGVAVNNVINAAFMVVGAGLIAGLSAVGLPPSGILALAGAATLAVAWWLGRKIPG